jgi:hypothetical protein
MFMKFLMFKATQMKTLNDLNKKIPSFGRELGIFMELWLACVSTNCATLLSTKIGAICLHQWLYIDLASEQYLWILWGLLPRVVTSLNCALSLSEELNLPLSGLLYLVLQNIILHVPLEVLLYYQEEFSTQSMFFPNLLRQYYEYRIKKNVVSLSR